MDDPRPPRRARPYTFALGLALALLVANVLVQPGFADPENIPAQLATLTPFLLIAVASTPAILSGGGGLDISVAPLAVVVNTVLVTRLAGDPVLGSAWMAIPLLLIFGAAIGATNGVVVAVLRFPPVIATLCMSFVLSGAALKIAPFPQSVTEVAWLRALGGEVGPVPGPLLLMAAPVLIWVLLGRTSYRQTLYAVGGNDAAAFASGVNVSATRIIAYAFGGMVAAIAGIALTALVLSTQASSSNTYTLVGLAAVALGGTSLGGGRGGFTGSVLGALCIFEMQTLLSALEVPSIWNLVAYGAMLLVGVIIGARAASTRQAAGVATA